MDAMEPSLNCCAQGKASIHFTQKEVEVERKQNVRPGDVSGLFKF